MEFNLADLFEAAVDAFGDREYLVAEGERRTYAEHGGPGQPAGPPPGRPGHRPRRPRRHLRLQQRRVGRDGVGGLQAARRLDQHQLPLRRGRAPLPVHERRPEGARPPARVLAPGDGRCCPSCRPSSTSWSSRTGRARRTRPARSRYEEALAEGSPDRDFGPAVRPTTSTSSTPAAPPGCPRAWSGATRTSSTPSAAASTRSTNTRAETARRRWSRRAATAPSPTCRSPR